MPPQLDEHETEIAAGVDDVWPALLDALDGGFSGTVARGYARMVGCADRSVSGPRPLAEGSTFPGFHVIEADPGRALVLEGRHHFSSYRLAFRLEAIGPGRTRLRAESRATFPGVHGRIYRLLVVSSGAHVASVRRLLSGIRRASEAWPDGA
jgi:hypothetical protein